MSILFCGFYGSWIFVFTLPSPFVIGDGFLHFGLISSYPFKLQIFSLG